MVRPGWENRVYTIPNIELLSFFKPRRPKHSQIGQSGYQTTPLHLYIQNIKLVSDWNQVLVRPGWENRVYTILNIKLLSFFKPRRPKHSQIGQSGYQTTPLHLYIQNIKLVSDWNQVLVRPGWENRVHTIPNIKLLSFFKPRRPKSPQIGQSGYQTTPLHLYIQNIKLVSDWNQVLVRPGWENRVYTIPNIKLLSFFKPRRPKHSQIGQSGYQTTPLYPCIFKLVGKTRTIMAGEWS